MGVWTEERREGGREGETERERRKGGQRRKEQEKEWEMHCIKEGTKKVHQLEKKKW